MVRRLARLAALAATSASFAVPARAIPVSAHADVYVAFWTGTTARVCAEGAVDDGTYIEGTWFDTMTGVAWSASPTPLPNVTAPVPRVHEGPSLYDCIDVPTVEASDYGVFQVNIGYAGAGTADVTGLAGLTLFWSPSTGIHQESFTTSA